MIDQDCPEAAAVIVGVILNEAGAATEPLLADFAAGLRVRGVDVGGLIQRSRVGDAGKPVMDLVDIRTGEEFRISQDLGSASAGCNLDTSGLADASRVLRREIAAGAQLLIINKFAGQECDGGGLAPEMFDAISRGIPVLTSLAPRNRPRWDVLTGNAGQMLAPRAEALWQWWRGVAGKTMPIVGLAGWSGSGKTTLMVELVRLLSLRGLSVSTIKHAHHAFDIDKPGKDSYRHREAGACEVMVSSGQRWALMHELRDAAEPSLEDLVARMQAVDLLMIEGFKTHAHDKIEIHRPAEGKPMLWPDDPHIIAIASDVPSTDAIFSGNTLPVLDLNDPAALVEFILTRAGLVPC
jgi:molybdopterin-guanine dinucleotide biosynthesis adapter protein